MDSQLPVNIHKICTALIATLFHLLLYGVCVPYTGAVAVGLAHYGQGEGPIVLDGVQCSGLETYITDCQHNGFFTHNCIHAEDAGVQCLG